MSSSSRRRNNSSLLESSTIITANLIMASSSYLLSKITPRPAPPLPPPPVPPAAAPTWRPPAAVHTRSVEPTIVTRTVFVAPVDGEDGKVDERAGKYIRRFRERTLSDIARMEAEAAAAVVAARPPPPPAPRAVNFAGTTAYGYYR
uniref:Uncharacterized protein n=1 Tax=Oryza brachyantha TaxID=4533 RepID=J3MDY3_ORYBR